MAKVQYTRHTGARLTYDIEADEFGRYTIALGGKVLRHGHEPLVLMGMLAPGPEREAEAIAAARSAITFLFGMRES